MLQEMERNRPVSLKAFFFVLRHCRGCSLDIAVQIIMAAASKCRHSLFYNGVG